MPWKWYCISFSLTSVPAVWFPFTTSTSSTPSLDMAHSSVIVTFPCKEIKIIITTIAAMWPFSRKHENNTKVEWIVISLRESLISPCGDVRSPFHYTNGSELLEELPHKNVTSVTCYFYKWTPHRRYGYKVNSTQMKCPVFPLSLYDKTILHGRLDVIELGKDNLSLVRCLHSWDIFNTWRDVSVAFQRATQYHVLSSLQIWKLGE